MSLPLTLRPGPDRGLARFRRRRAGGTAVSRQSSAFCGDSRVAHVDGHHPGDVGWSSTEHGVLAAGDGASRRRQQSQEARRQDVSASGQLAPRPRWEQPTRCVSVWSRQASPSLKKSGVLQGPLMGRGQALSALRQTAPSGRRSRRRDARPPERGGTRSARLSSRGSRREKCFGGHLLHRRPAVLHSSVHRHRPA